MNDIVYEEWVPVGRFVKALIGLILVLISSILLITVVTGAAIEQPFLTAVFPSVAAFVLLLLWNYKGIRIDLDTETLRVRYGILNRKRIPMENVVSCEPARASFRRYGGVGVRYGLDGSWAYTTSFGDAVRVNLRRGRPFVFSSNHPEKICGIVRQNIS